MSNIFRDILPFVPTAQRMNPGQQYSGALLNFHDTLLYLAYCYNTARFENLPASLFHDYRRMDSESVKRGREQAAALKWIGYEPGWRGTFTYWFLDLDGQKLQPKPNPKSNPKPCWRYRTANWQMHLERRVDRRQNAEGQESTSIGKMPKVNPRPSAKCPTSKLDHRQNAEGHSGEVTENVPVDSNRAPLEFLRTSDEVRTGNSEGVASASDSDGLFGVFSESEESPIVPWDEIARVGPTKKVTRHVVKKKHS